MRNLAAQLQDLIDTASSLATGQRLDADSVSDLSQEILDEAWHARKLSAKPKYTLEFNKRKRELSHRIDVSIQRLREMVFTLTERTKQ